jgi:hypothetical protein
MRLAVARLCLDCEEIHDGECCPVCGSETFAFLTRWVRPAERPRPKQASRGKTSDSSDQVDTYKKLLGGARRPRLRRAPLLGLGAVALALVGLTRFARRAWRTPSTVPLTANEVEELQKSEKPTP